MPRTNQDHIETQPAPQRSSPEKHTKSGVRLKQRELHEVLKDITPDTYLPRLIGKGSDHLVFESQDTKHAGVVFKINFQESIPVLEASITQKGSSPSVTERHRIQDQREALLEKMYGQMKERTAKLRELKEYFGAAAVPVERLLIREVPISREVVENLLPSQAPKDTQEIPATLPVWVAIQRKLKMNELNTMELYGYFPEYPGAMKNEKPEQNSAEYEVGHDILMGNAKEPTDPKEKKRSKEVVLDMYPDMKKIDDLARLSPEFMETLRNAVKAFIKYTDETSNILDFGGKGNIVIMNEGGKWQLKMPDPFLSIKELSFYELAVVATKLGHGDPVSPDLTGKALIALNAVRVMNALAIIADIPDRVDIPSSVKAIDISKWTELIKRAYNWKGPSVAPREKRAAA